MLAYLVVGGTLSVDGLDTARVEVGERVTGVDGQSGVSTSSLTTPIDACSLSSAPQNPLLPRIVNIVRLLGLLVLVHVVTHEGGEAAHP